ncbi:hypothetical protein [Cerasicoccus frondis]|uniref:hypothetical protein n=1 Tax=Cerasicoccus frondis TaxID=490090 RepID=UPI002852AC00|nr:hypothetical protein [Cerasicoccus frondis]
MEIWTSDKLIERITIHALNGDRAGELIIGNIEFHEKLQLAGINVPFPVCFNSCKFLRHLDLRYSKWKTLSFSSCEMHAIRTDCIKVKGDLLFYSGLEKPFIAYGTIWLVNADVTGDLVFTGGIFFGSSADDDAGESYSGVAKHIRTYGSIDARGSTIGGSLKLNASGDSTSVLQNRFAAKGLLNFQKTKIGGDIFFSGGRIQAGRCYRGKGESLSFIPSSALGNFLFSEFKCRYEDQDHGPVRNFIRASKSGVISEKEASSLKYKYRKIVLSADFYGSRIDGSVFFDRGFISHGTIRFAQVVVGNSITFSGSRLYEIGFTGIKNDQVSSVQLTYLKQAIALLGFQSHYSFGSFDGFNMKVGGSIYLSSDLRTFNSIDSKKILDSKEKNDTCSQESSTRYNHYFLSCGTFIISGSEISGRVVISNACFVKSDDSLIYQSKHALALDAASITVEKNFLSIDDSIYIGSIRIARSRIGGRLQLGSSKVFAVKDPGSISLNKRVRPGAIDAQGISIGRELRFSRGFVALGNVRFSNAKIGASVHAYNSIFSISSPFDNTDLNHYTSSMVDYLEKIVGLACNDIANISRNELCLLTNDWALELDLVDVSGSIFLYRNDVQSISLNSVIYFNHYYPKHCNLKSESIKHACICGGLTLDGAKVLGQLILTKSSRHGN